MVREEEWKGVSSSFLNDCPQADMLQFLRLLENKRKGTIPEQINCNLWCLRLSNMKTEATRLISQIIEGIRFLDTLTLSRASTEVCTVPKANSCQKRGNIHRCNFHQKIPHITRGKRKQRNLRVKVSPAITQPQKHFS
jgi:hypothetical protein